MRIGIIALAAVFFASGYKYMRDAGLTGRKGKAGAHRGYDRRKLGFSLLMFLVGVLVLIYYIVTL